jgi:fumarate reductase subunit C
MHGATASRPAGYPWRMSAGWWLKNPRYFLYMIRELTAVFAALWVVLFMLQLPQIAAAPREWANDVSSSPGWILFSFVSLLFVVYHAWTFFTATGTAVYVRIGKTATPAGAINGATLVGWAVATVVIGFILLAPVLGR